MQVEIQLINNNGTVKQIQINLLEGHVYPDVVVYKDITYCISMSSLARAFHGKSMVQYNEGKVLHV